MLITSKRLARSGCSSTLSLAIWILLRVLGGDLLEDGGDHLAGSAPLRPEVDEDGSLAGADELVEGGVGKGADSLGHGVPLCGVGGVDNPGALLMLPGVAYQLVSVECSWSVWASSQRSASMAAMQPDPAAVMAWR